VAHPEFFSNQFHARCAYSYQGIDSDMESGWIGGGVVEQEQAGGDGRHLSLSWISQEGVDDDGRYQVMLANVELERAMIQPSAAPSSAPSLASPATRTSVAGDVKVNAGSSICHGRDLVEIVATRMVSNVFACF
jgi:hypothetical protein